nr:hypothetical protein [Tanacetum cinerariifolium]
KTTQANDIASLKRRVKKLERKNSSRTHKLKRLYKERRIDDIDADKDITMVNDQDDAEMFDVSALDGEEVFVTKQDENVVEETITITIEELTLAQALEALKSSKPKVKGVVIQEPSESTTTTTTIPKQHSLTRVKE